MMATVSLWCVALLFGGMVLYAFGLAPFLFSALPMPQARRVLRMAFPHFYLFVMSTSAMAALLFWARDGVSAVAMAAIAVSTVPARQVLMPAINTATDAGATQRFKLLHTFSVLVTLGHIALAGWALARFA
jgi:hypothetical protein